MSFLIRALSEAQFQHLHCLSTEELAAHRAVRMVVDKKPGFPCRVSLADAEPGETVILVNYEHHSVNSPFRASHAIYIRPLVTEAKLHVGEVPEMLLSRMLSVRGFDQGGMLLSADLCEGTGLAGSIASAFGNSDVSYLHIHFAKPGCYAARVDRA